MTLKFKKGLRVSEKFSKEVLIYFSEMASTQDADQPKVV